MKKGNGNVPEKRGYTLGNFHSDTSQRVNTGVESFREGKPNLDGKSAGLCSGDASKHVNRSNTHKSCHMNVVHVLSLVVEGLL